VPEFASEPPHLVDRLAQRDDVAGLEQGIGPASKPVEHDLPITEVFAYRDYLVGDVELIVKIVGAVEPHTTMDEDCGQIGWIGQPPCHRDCFVGERQPALSRRNEVDPMREPSENKRALTAVPSIETFERLFQKCVSRGVGLYGGRKDPSVAEGSLSQEVRALQSPGDLGGIEESSVTIGVFPCFVVSVSES
jgi:hypothetical protein